MLQPKRTKFRKFQKGKIGGVKINTLSFGKYGVQSLESGRLKASVIEAVRRVMTRKLKRNYAILVAYSKTNPGFYCSPTHNENANL